MSLLYCDWHCNDYPGVCLPPLKAPVIRCPSAATEPCRYPECFCHSPRACEMPSKAPKTAQEPPKENTQGWDSLTAEERRWLRDLVWFTMHTRASKRSAELAQKVLDKLF